VVGEPVLPGDVRRAARTTLADRGARVPHHPAGTAGRVDHEVGGETATVDIDPDGTAALAVHAVHMAGEHRQLWLPRGGFP
jgi:hypothetical protein